MRLSCDYWVSHPKDRWVSSQFNSIRLRQRQREIVLTMRYLGPLASKIMAQIGPVARRSLYATFQSAGMGGYGRAAVNGVVRGGNAVMGAVKWWKNSGKNEEEDAERGDKKKGKERRGKPGRGQMVGVQNKSFEDLVADRLCCVTKTHQEESD